MFKGKRTCKILKEIRKQIAQNNDIEFVTSECKHQGDCLGTCPKCEAELKDLGQERVALEAELSGGNLGFERLTELSKRIEEVIAAIDQRELRWLELNE